jgi:NADH-quinone oxidoreductase subunit M
MPTYGAFAALAFMASMGMPFFCGFAGEFFVLLGAAASPHISVYVLLTVLAGMLTGAGYAIYTYRRLFLGKLFLRTDMPEGDFFDIKTHEKVVLVLMTAAAFLFGIYPKLLWQGFEGSLLRMAALAH